MPFVRSTKFEGTFEGQPVTAMLSPLTYDDLLSLPDSGTPKQLAAIFCPMVRKYASDLTGVRDATGNLVNIDDVTTYSYFAPLLIDMGKALASAGVVTDPKQPAERSDG